MGNSSTDDMVNTAPPGSRVPVGRLGSEDKGEYGRMNVRRRFYHSQNPLGPAVQIASVQLSNRKLSSMALPTMYDKRYTLCHICWPECSVKSATAVRQLPYPSGMSPSCPEQKLVSWYGFPLYASTNVLWRFDRNGPRMNRLPRANSRGLEFLIVQSRGTGRHAVWKYGSSGAVMFRLYAVLAKFRYTSSRIQHV